MTFEEMYSPAYAQARAQMAPAIQSAAATYGIDPRLLEYVAGVESRWGTARGLTTPGAAGELGEFQQTPAFVQQYGINPLDRQSAADGAARALRRFLDMSNGDVGLAMVGYNGGEGRLRQVLSGERDLGALPQITRDYVAGARQALGLEPSAPRSVGSYSRPVEQALAKYRLPTARRVQGSTGLGAALAPPIVDSSQVSSAAIPITGVSDVPRPGRAVTLAELDRLLGATQSG